MSICAPRFQDSMVIFSHKIPASMLSELVKICWDKAGEGRQIGKQLVEEKRREKCAKSYTLSRLPTESRRVAARLSSGAY